MRDAWSTLLSFVVDVVKVINVGPQGTHIGAVTFGDHANLILGFNDLNKTTDYEMMVSEVIESIPRPLLGQRKFINRGLRLANREVMSEEFGMRPNAKQVRTFCNSLSLFLSQSPSLSPTPSICPRIPPLSPCICVLKKVQGHSSCSYCQVNRCKENHKFYTSVKIRNESSICLAL